MKTPKFDVSEIFIDIYDLNTHSEWLDWYPDIHGLWHMQTL